MPRARVPRPKPVCCRCSGNSENSGSEKQNTAEGSHSRQPSTVSTLTPFCFAVNSLAKVPSCKIEGADFHLGLLKVAQKERLTQSPIVIIRIVPIKIEIIVFIEVEVIVIGVEAKEQIFHRSWVQLNRKSKNKAKCILLFH